MNMNEYQERALRTASEPGTLELSEELHRYLRIALGICSEGGELANHLKKVLFQGHKIDKALILDELGDVLWYVAVGARYLGMSLEDLAYINLAKLHVRYPDGFTPCDSLNRIKEILEDPGTNWEAEGQAAQLTLEEYAGKLGMTTGVDVAHGQDRTVATILPGPTPENGPPLPSGKRTYVGPGGIDDTRQEPPPYPDCSCPYCKKLREEQTDDLPNDAEEGKEESNES